MTISFRSMWPTPCDRNSVPEVDANAGWTKEVIVKTTKRRYRITVLSQLLPMSVVNKEVWKWRERSPKSA